jgi:hypothetical protein
MHFRYFVMLCLLCSCSTIRSTTNEFGPSSSSLDAFNGRLAGFSRGEWGGKLVFFPSRGKEVELLDENVAGIFKTPNGIVVFTGLAHLSLNKGEVYAVVQNPDKSIAASLLVTLPGAPFKPVQIENGGVLFGVLNGSYDGGNGLRRPLFKCYVLNSPSSLEPAACTNGLKSEL